MPHEALYESRLFAFFFPSPSTFAIVDGKYEFMVARSGRIRATGKQVSLRVDIVSSFDTSPARFEILEISLSVLEGPFFYPGVWIIFSSFGHPGYNAPGL